MKVFIVRPFGNRQVPLQDKKTGGFSTVQFDFDKVEAELIKPAMKSLQLTGGTTGEVFEAGDIREDMFTELLLADIVIADITIHNANVFYELGIRHALRNKRTILIKCEGFDQTPFDILGYRYLSYKKEDPAAALKDLVRSIKETIDADRVDSPVFTVLPRLDIQDTEKYLALPEDFINEVKLAEEVKSVGKLALLTYESESFGWHLPALRLIGEALFRGMANTEARETARTVWEKVKRAKPHDLQANKRLATIYLRLADNGMKTNPDEGIALLVKSDLSIEELLTNNALSNIDRAEAYALKASNAKTRWVNSWKEMAAGERGRAALRSLHLEAAFKNYEKGFYEDLNHFYSGINALWLLSIIIELAAKNPDTWELAYDTTEDAEQKLKEYKVKYERIANAMQLVIAAAKIKQESKYYDKDWLSITEADFICITSKNPARVAAIYTQVLKDAKDSNAYSAFRQLKIYEALEIKTENISAALAAIESVNPQPKKTAHYLLFTGHLIDKPGRESPRFPNSKAAEVKELIREKIIQSVKGLDEMHYPVGIGGGASGGDIIFHELCQEMNIPSHLYLALPRDQFVTSSVEYAGRQWIDRFNKLFNTLPHPILSDHKELPKWLREKPGYDIWTRNNLWELNSALINGSQNMTLLALWDGEEGDGSGGTAHMVKEARSHGVVIEPIYLQTEKKKQPIQKKKETATTPIEATAPSIQKTATPDPTLPTIADKEKIELLKKIDALLDEPTEENIKSTMDILAQLTRSTSSTRFVLALRADFIQYKQDKLAGYNMAGRLNSLLVRLTEIIEDVKKPSS